MTGGAGHDAIEGGEGNDVIVGGAGDDKLQGHGGAHKVDSDTVSSCWTVPQDSGTYTVCCHPRSRYYDAEAGTCTNPDGNTFLAITDQDDIDGGAGDDEIEGDYGFRPQVFPPSHRQATTIVAIRP